MNLWHVGRPTEAVGGSGGGGEREEGRVTVAQKTSVCDKLIYKVACSACHSLHHYLPSPFLSQLLSFSPSFGALFIFMHATLNFRGGMSNSDRTFLSSLGCDGSPLSLCAAAVSFPDTMIGLLLSSSF